MKQDAHGFKKQNSVLKNKNLKEKQNERDV